MRFYNPATGVVGIRRSVCVNDKRGRMSVKNENIGFAGVSSPRKSSRLQLEDAW